MSKALPPEQARVLEGLEPSKRERVPDVAERLGMDQAQVAAAAVTLQAEGWVAIEEEPYREWVLAEGAERSLQEGIPERRVLRALLEHGGSGTMAELPGWSGLEPKQVGQSLKGLQSRGWATKTGPTLEVTPAGKAAAETPGEDERALDFLCERVRAGAGRRVVETEVAGAGIDVEPAKALLGSRNPFCEVREKTHRWLLLTEFGLEFRSAGVESRREVSQITPELLVSGEWRQVDFKPYDVDLATEPLYPGKKHPLQRVIERTRKAFLEMGFEEAVSPYVESGFWDFDALFQPQDHPAREMQDTFYVETPGQSSLPEDREMVERVRRTHEDGGETGSVGWRYQWDPAKAKQNVLRTHTTATTIRALAANPKGPRKVFSIGRVFRRETIDYKHLPIFYQVDGIIVDEGASLASLMGTLGAFYESMGFDKFIFRPGFFPYTEPSVEVFIWHEEKQDWFEMGGSGIFRPEVTEPLGCTEPVLAWGLGLDRLAMLLYDRKDIRDLYLSDLEWLRTEPRCR